MIVRFTKDELIMAECLPVLESLGKYLQAQTDNLVRLAHGEEPESLVAPCDISDSLYTTIVDTEDERRQEEAEHKALYDEWIAEQLRELNGED